MQETQDGGQSPQCSRWSPIRFAELSLWFDARPAGKFWRSTILTTAASAGLSKTARLSLIWISLLVFGAEPDATSPNRRSFDSAEVRSAQDERSSFYRSFRLGRVGGEGVRS